MRIQTIQSTNNNNKTDFKARFINDKNGNFIRLWDDAWKSADLFNKAKEFRNGLPADSLEILSIKNLDLLTSGYEVLNHNTGKKSLYKISDNSPKYGVLGYLIDLIHSDKTLFEKDFSTNIYNFLLGKK